MRIISLIAATAAATLVIPAMSVPAAAAGQEHVVVKTKTVERHDTSTTDRHDDGNDRHDRRHATWKRHCTTVVRHHHRITTCRRVRVWH